MSLAQRVRDFRYSKGWGPDELANRAEISRTALYQIESGKTGLPRAGTLRRIAVALEVPMEDLLGDEIGVDDLPQSGAERVTVTRRSPGLYELIPADGGPLAIPSGPSFRPVPTTPKDDLRFAIEPVSSARTNGHESIYVREGELMSKLHDLLHSPLGESVARIVEELHAVIPRSRPLA